MNAALYYHIATKYGNHNSDYIKQLDTIYGLTI